MMRLPVSYCHETDHPGLEGRLLSQQGHSNRLWYAGALVFLPIASCTGPAVHTAPSSSAAVTAATSMAAVSLQGAALPIEVRFFDHGAGVERKHFVRFGQCQFRLAPSRDTTRRDRLFGPVDPGRLRQRLDDCLETARRESLNILILPELSLTLPSSMREDWLRHARERANADSLIIIAGSYYDPDSYSRLVVIGPGWVERGYKLRPSRFEVSPRAGEGMRPGQYLTVVRTPFGTLAVLTCVDLISDDVQYAIRRLATRGEIDAVININHNPAALEFLVEANSIARRHPVFVSITNVASDTPDPKCSDGYDESHGYCYGNTAIFASLRTRASDEPNSVFRLHDLLPSYLLDDFGNRRVERRLAYDNVVGALTAHPEQMLVYELNMWLTREPLATNAPDQGYPTVRALRIVDLPDLPR